MMLFDDNEDAEQEVEVAVDTHSETSEFVDDDAEWEVEEMAAIKDDDDDDCSQEADMEASQMANDVEVGVTNLKEANEDDNESEITSAVSTLLIKSFAVRHNLTTRAQDDLLKLLHLSVNASSLPSSLHAFKKSSTPVTPPQMWEHLYCPQCFTILDDHACSTCPNSDCQKSIIQGSCPSFITVSLSDQLKTFLESTYDNFSWVSYGI